MGSFRAEPGGYSRSGESGVRGNATVTTLTCSLANASCLRLNGSHCFRAPARPPPTGSSHPCLGSRVLPGGQLRSGPVGAPSCPGSAPARAGSVEGADEETPVGVNHEAGRAPTPSDRRQTGFPPWSRTPSRLLLALSTHPPRPRRTPLPTLSPSRGLCGVPGLICRGPRTAAVLVGL